jgi:hypothetical protein
MISLGKSPSAQANIKTAIDELRLEIENLEAENHANQAVYEDLVQEMKAKLEQRIREVKERGKIKPFADLQAASLATDQKVQALAMKLDSADAANELLS